MLWLPKDISPKLTFQSISYQIVTKWFNSMDFAALHRSWLRRICECLLITKKNHCVELVATKAAFTRHESRKACPFTLSYLVDSDLDVFYKCVFWSTKKQSRNLPHILCSPQSLHNSVLRRKHSIEADMSWNEKQWYVKILRLCLTLGYQLT